MNTYNRFPLCITRGKGARLWNDSGEMFVDAFAGVAVVNLGHSHPKVVSAIKKQVALLTHVSNWVYNDVQNAFAEKLVSACPRGLEKVFLCNSGAEANEGAFKLARKKTGKKKIVACVDAFHGRTFGALSLTWKQRYKEPFQPLAPGVAHVAYGDAEEIRKEIDNETAAVWVEPVLGEGGVLVPPDGFLKQVREICDEKEVLLVLDEVQTGIGRTGKMFACQHEGVVPDVICIAKALANGLPVGAVVSTEETANAFGPGDHGSTFAGGPVVCAAGLATLNEMEHGGWARKAGEAGEAMRSKLHKTLDGNKAVREIRGLGLLNGVELEQNLDARTVCERMLEQHVIATPVSHNTVRLTPPLVISKPLVEKVVEALENAVY